MADLLQGQSAVITGGARGIGFGIAEELLRSGVSKVLILDLGEHLEETKKMDLMTFNPKARVFYSQCDITDKQQLEKVLRKDAVQWLGSIDIVVNCAGVIDEFNPERCIGTNLTALINCSMIALDLMTKEKQGRGGTIVNISSVAGLQGVPCLAVYCASKSGVIGFTRSVGVEPVFQLTGVKMVAICPGATETGMYHDSTEIECSFPTLKTIIDEMVQTMPLQNQEENNTCCIISVDTNMTLEGKSAVVIGGAGGIGIEICKKLLSSGLAKLAILDVNELPIETIRDQIAACNTTAQIVSMKCDITNKSNLDDAIRGRVLAQFGYIDLLVNSAGTVDERDPERLLAINVTGVVNSSLMALELMSKEYPGGRGGTIVNISSIAGLEPTPFLCVYSASKFAVTGFTRSISNDLIYNRTGVKCITICPGITDTTLLSKFFAGQDLLFPWMSSVASSVKNNYPSQSPSDVGDCVAKAVLDGENGSVWIVNGGSSYKMEIPANQFVKQSSTN
ncbi:hypothetical protein RP20_CCG024933 [Aedes albopictus]|nr:hypothetical protein RP20_CCG024933 [Aedes albopictus]